MKYIFVLFLFLGNITFADEKVCDTTDPSKCSQYIRKGEVAEFDGQLLSTELAISLGQKVNDANIKLNIEVDRIKKLSEIDLSLEKKLHELDIQAWNKEKEIMINSMKNMENSIPFYERPWFVAIVTAVGVGFLSYGMYSINSK